MAQGRKKGSPKTGGRLKGTPNKVTERSSEEVQIKLEAKLQQYLPPEIG